MTTALPNRLLLDRLSVHGPMIRISCELIRQGPIGADRFRQLICPGQPQSELLPFLLDSGLVEQTTRGLRLSRIYRPDWTPELNLLRLLHGRRDSNYTFRFIWEALLEHPEWDGGMVNRDDLWPVINQVKPEGATLPTLNQNRMASWLRLASWIGLVQPERSNTVCLVPTPALLTELMAATLQPGREVPMAAWVAEIEAQFCRITIRNGEVARGVALGLIQQLSAAHIRLATYSDMQLFQVGSLRASHLAWMGGLSA